MKRFMLFMYDKYYPDGGMSDFKGSFDTREEVLEKVYDIMHLYDYYQIYDIETEQFVYYNDPRCG